MLEHPPASELYEQGAKPAAFRLELLQITVVAVFFTEDFRRLKRGIQTLKGAYGPTLDFLPTDIESWLDGRTHVSGAWANCGMLEFRDALGGLISSAWVHLFRVAPSVACLAVTAYPVTDATQQLEHVLTCRFEPSDRLRFAWSRGSRWKWYGVVRRPSYLRSRAVDHLSERINRALSRLLREHVGVGWTAGKVLPAIETFGHWSGAAALASANDEFWDALGMRLAHPLNYRRSDGITLFADDDHSDTRRPYPRQRLLVDIPDLLEGKDLRGYIDERSAIDQTLFDRVGHLAVAVALREHTRRLEAAVGQMRSDLAPQLSGRRWHRRTRLWLSRAFRHIQELNRLSFDKNRVSSELDWTQVDDMTHRELRHFTRQGFGGEDKGVSLVDDLAHNFARRWTYITQQTDVLREAFRSRLDYSVQQVMARLTVVGIGLTVVGVLLAIPETYRVGMWKALISSIRSAISLLLG